MSGSGDQRLSAALLARLEGGAADVLSLLVAARANLGTALVGHEGAVHALLHRLQRRGIVRVVGTSTRGLAEYGLPRSDASGGAGGAVTSSATSAAPPRDEALCDKAPRDEALCDKAPRDEALWAARGVRSAVARARIALDVDAHLGALEATGRRADLGTLRALRGLVKRADRGHPAVFLPLGAGGHALRFLLHEGPWIAGAVALYLVLNAFVVKVFVIPSPSMLPTLQPGDRVVVRQTGDGWIPARWRIVTFQRPGQDGPHTTFVKRAVGLPGEEIALWRGDVYIDGELVAKPEDMNALVRRRVKAWDLARADDRQGWMVKSAEAGVDSWSLGEHFWAGSQEVERRFELQDVYLELDVDLGSSGGAMLRVMRGREQLERVAFALEADARHGVALTRDDPGGLEKLAGEARAVSGRQTLRLSVVDGLVQASLGDFAWEERLAQSKSLPAEPAVVSFVVREGARPLAFRLDQDLHYGLDGVLAVAKDGQARGPVDVGHKIGDDAIFCLGDNTHDSRDSRYQDVGDVPIAQLIGPVVWRLWPPGRFGRVR